MSRIRLQGYKNPIIIPLLAGELENEIPNLDIHGSEKKLLDFAYRDLETCLIEKMNDVNSSEINKILNESKLFVLISHNISW